MSKFEMGKNFEGENEKPQLDEPDLKLITAKDFNNLNFKFEGGGDKPDENLVKASKAVKEFILIFGGSFDSSDVGATEKRKSEWADKVKKDPNTVKAIKDKRDRDWSPDKPSAKEMRDVLGDNSIFISSVWKNFDDGEKKLFLNSLRTIYGVDKPGFKIEGFIGFLNDLDKVSTNGNIENINSFKGEYGYVLNALERFSLNLFQALGE